MKTILLTGATGFLGSHLLEALLEEDYSVVVLKRSTSSLWRIENLLSKVASYEIDFGGVEKAFRTHRVDAVIHTACEYGRNGERLSSVLDANLVFGVKVLEAAILSGVKCFLNTDTLLSSNLNLYSLSKSQFTRWLELSSDKIKVVNLKLEHMYGPKDNDSKFVSWLIAKLEGNVDKIELTAGEQLRDFIYIDDVVSAYMLALKKIEDLRSFTEFEVGTGRSISVRFFVGALKAAYEKKRGPSNTLLDFGAIPYRLNELMSVKVDNSGLVQLGWSPKISLRSGLSKVIGERE